jgi:integral membrane sensor domain MASE1
MLKFGTSYLRLRHMLEILFTAAVYFILARLSLLLQFQSSNATPVWPPSGFAFAIMLLLGHRIAPGIMLGAFAGNLFVFLSNKTCGLNTAIWLSFVISIGNTSESLLGYYFLNKIIPHARVKNIFLNVNHIFRFSFVTGLMCLVSCTIGATAVFLAKTITTNQYSIVWLTWWLGDVSGILLTTPFILLWAKSFRSPSTIFIGSWKRKTEAAALFLTVLLWSAYIFGNSFFPFSVFKRAFWMIPILVWAALRFMQRETITAIVLCCAVAIWGTVNNRGPFAALSFNESLLTVQAFVSIMAITQLALNASVYERRQTEARLRGLSNQLEIRVQKRTAELAHSANELAKKNKELEKINQELDSFTYIAIHDLQEPLRKIQTFANIILEKEIEALPEKGKIILSECKLLHRECNSL